MLVLTVTLVSLFLSSHGSRAQVVEEIPVEGGPIVHSTPGVSYRGIYKVSSDGKRFNAFLGIPFAKPPVGELRLQTTQPYVPTKGEWNATVAGPNCIYYNYYASAAVEGVLSGKEDCLYLNVYTPKLNGSLDVIVFIHGGAFTHGSSVSYQPDYLLNKDIILVTITYRLGPLGFLSTEDDVIPGNFGLKDQTMALRWVNENIKYFGGNPKSITISGQSAGGASVHYHYLGKLSRGLFQRGISVSGSALNPWAFQEGSRIKANRLAAGLSCNTTSTTEMLKCLRNKTAEEVVNQLGQFIVWGHSPFTPFGPVKEVQHPGAFLTENPYEVMKRGGAQDLPWMTGITTEEGLYSGMPVVETTKTLADLDQNYLVAFPALLDYNYTVDPSVIDVISKVVRVYYLQERPIANATIAEVIKMMSDRLFNVGVLDGAQLHTDTANSKTYLYLFEYAGNYSYTDSFHTGRKYGVSHLDDVQFIFKHRLFDWPARGSKDDQMTKLWVDMWVNFAATGVPVSTLLPLSWPPVKRSSSDLNYLRVISPDSLVPAHGLMQSSRDFWNELPLLENEHVWSPPPVGVDLLPESWIEQLDKYYSYKVSSGGVTTYATVTTLTIGLIATML